MLEVCSKPPHVFIVSKVITVLVREVSLETVDEEIVGLPARLRNKMRTAKSQFDRNRAQEEKIGDFG